MGALLAVAIVARSLATEVIGVILLLLADFVIATLISFAYQATVRLETWKLITDFLAIPGATSSIVPNLLPKVRRIAGGVPARR